MRPALIFRTKDARRRLVLVDDDSGKDPRVVLPCPGPAARSRVLESSHQVLALAADSKMAAHWDVDPAPRRQRKGVVRLSEDT